MPKPKLFIFSGADRVTGALISAINQQKQLGKAANVTLILSSRTNLVIDGPVLLLPLARAEKSVRSMLTYPFALVRAGCHLHRALKNAGCDLLLINDFHFAEATIVRLLRYRGRIVTWVRIEPSRFGLVGQFWLALARWSSDELVVVSKFIASRLPPEYRLTLIYDAVELASVTPRSQSRQLLFIGNYIEGKGQDDAIKAFHLVAAHFPTAELRFHGSDMGLKKNHVYRANLQLLADDGDGAGRIVIGDFIDDPHPLYDNAYAALNFSHSESFSLTCAEACAHGLPVIATRCGGPEEIIEDKHSGYLVAVGDVDAMAERMADLLGNAVKAEAMGNAGRQLVGERFGTAKSRHQLLKIFGLA